jgi:phosphatidylserine synthase
LALSRLTSSSNAAFVVVVVTLVEPVALTPLGAMLLYLSSYYVAQINEMKKLIPLQIKKCDIPLQVPMLFAVCHAVCCILNLAVFSLYARSFEGTPTHMRGPFVVIHILPFC